MKETPLGSNLGKAVADLVKGIHYGYYLELDGHYPSSNHLDLRDHSGNEPIRLSLDLYSFEEMVEKGIPVRLNNVFFEENSTLMKSGSLPELKRLASFLKENPEIKIELGVHASTQSSATKNLELSQKRAAGLAKFLAKAGANPENITPKGYGETAPNTSGKNPSLNERIEFRILSGRIND